jgi:hypothetical protein
MAARRRSGRTKTTAARGARGLIAERLARLERGLPSSLRDYAAELRRRLDGLEREVTRAQLDVRRRAARLLRDASHLLGKLEAGGEAGWSRLAAPARRQLLDLLRRLETAVAPPPLRRRATRRPRAARSAG